MSKIKRMIALLDHERIGYVEIAFKVIYILHLLMSFNIFMTGQGFLNVTVASVVLLGCFLLLCRVCHIKLYLRTPGVMFLALFAASFLIPSFLIYRYDLFSSIKTVLWMAFQFCILFCFSTGKKEAAVKKEFLAVSVAIHAFVTLENIFSLLMLITEYYNPYQTPDGTYFLAGLTPWGRLFGVHTDPNYACVYTLTAVLIAVYLFKKFKNVFVRILACATALINFIFVALTASRTGLVCAAVAAACYVLFLSFKHLNKKILLRTAVLTVCAVVLIVGAHTAVVKGYNGINAWLAGSSAPETPAPDASTPDTSTPDQSGDSATTTPPVTSDRVNIGRTEEELGGDISNRRFDIWCSGLEIFKANPVFGIGFENVLGYAHDRMPETYIVNNDHSDFDAFHNTLVDVLVSQGVVGMLLLLGFVIKYLIAFCKSYFKISAACRDEAVLCLAVCLMTLASAMFLSHVFYVNCPTTYIFWAYAGYLAYFFTQTKKARTVTLEGPAVTTGEAPALVTEEQRKGADLISVIVPVYNAAEYLGRCVDSILKQTYQNLEIILVDDGSADDSPRLCDEYAKVDGRVRVIHKENQGPAETRNRGLDEATGAMIVFVDSDDWLPESYVAVLHRALVREGADMAVCDMWITDGETYRSINEEGSAYMVLDSASAVETLLLQKEFDTGPHCKIYKKGLFENRRFPQGVLLFEDFDLLFRIAFACERVVYTAETQYFYYQNAGSIMHRTMSDRHLVILEVSERMLTSVTERFPHLARAAHRRHLESIFFLLDKILYSKSGKRYVETVKAIKKSLRANFRYIFFNRYIKTFSKLKVLALLLGFPLYGALVRLKDLAVGNH